MKDCPRGYDCDGCIFKGTLDCPFEDDDCLFEDDDYDA